MRIMQIEYGKWVQAIKQKPMILVKLIQLQPTKADNPLKHFKKALNDEGLFIFQIVEF